MKSLDKIIENASLIAIGGHVRPDGDCIGSLTAVKEYVNINYPDKLVDCFVEEVPDALTFLVKEDFRVRKNNAKPYDLFITLDCADRERLGETVDIFDQAEKTVCIDHHISNIGFADENIISADTGSTCELLCSLLDFNKLNQHAAVCLYTGIIHDTGVLQYSNTTPDTLRTVARLLEFRFDFSEIIEKSFYSKTYVQNKLLGFALTKSRLELGNKCMISAVSLDERDALGAKDDDFEGIVNQLRLTEECALAVLMHEIKPDVWRVSMRSKREVDLIPIARANDGGGHTVAAGCTIYGTETEAYEKLLKDIEENL